MDRLNLHTFICFPSEMRMNLDEVQEETRKRHFYSIIHKSPGNSISSSMIKLEHTDIALAS